MVIFGIRLVTALSNAFADKMQNIRGVVNSVFKFIANHISISMRIIKGIIKTTLSILKGDWKGAWEGIKQIIKGNLDAVKLILKTAGSAMLQAGKNLINMLIEGIKAKIGELKNVVGGIAQSIKNRIGFQSPAKLGPGRDADKWAPNLMDMFISGISAKIGELEIASNSIAAPLGNNLPSMGNSQISRSGNIIMENPQFVNEQMSQLMLQRAMKTLIRGGI
jgi:phage-related protein